MRNILHIGLLLGLAAGASGCATTQAVALVERPALDVPPVPSRVVESVLAARQVPEPVPDLPPPPVNPRPKAAPQRDTAKPEPKPETPPVEAPAPTPPPAAPATPPLRTASSPEGAEAVRQITDLRNRASQLLDVTDYQKLTREQQAQHDNARRFIAEADEALKAKNFEFAKGVAEKAERLARELQGREELVNW